MRHRLVEGGVQYISLIGCKLPPLDGYVAVCLVLTIEVFYLLPRLSGGPAIYLLGKILL